MLGSGGNVGLGKDGRLVGNVGKGVLLGSGGNVAVGMFGMVVGNGGNLGIVGIVGNPGEVCRRLRAAFVTWMLENDKAMIKDRTKQRLEEAAIDGLLMNFQAKNCLVLSRMLGNCVCV